MSSRNVVHWVNKWAMTYDPREPVAVQPFDLFPKQAEFLTWLAERERLQEDGLVEKSRDMGASWLCCAYALHGWLFRPGYQVGFGSRKLEYVDEKGDPKSIFEKLRLLLQYLPAWMVPAGFNWKEHSCHAKLINPANGATITGEGGDNIGRGGRSSVYFVDEAQPLTARVMTPTGWRAMGEMAPGCVITGADGSPQTVVGINDCGEHDVIRVGFSDGTSVECSPGHLWVVDKAWGKRERLTVRAADLLDDFIYTSPGGQTQYLYRVPTCEPVEFASNEPLPLDPYLVGALLGDGHVGGGTVRVTSADPEIIDSFRRLLPAGIVVGAFDGRYTHNIVDPKGRGRGRPPFVKNMLIAVGIYKYKGPDKFIPGRYKYAPPKDRLALLQGLMDTDGHATKQGSASFHTSSKRLADDVEFLVQSLGGTCWRKVKADKRGYRDQHSLQVALPAGMPVFRLSRKRDRMGPRKHPLGRTITSVEKVGRGQVRCISVSNADGLYLTDNFVVTHNSAFLERPQLVDRALSQTTRVRIDVSTPNGPGNPFANKRESGRVAVFTMHWRDDPRKGEEWYAEQKRRFDAVTVAQEIDIDYTASVEGIVIPGKWVQAAVGLQLSHDGPKVGGLDIGEEGSNLSVLVSRQSSTVLSVDSWGQANTTQTAHRAREACEKAGIAELYYDAQGVGAGVKGVFKSSDRPLSFKAHAILSGGTPEDTRWPDGRTSRERFLNLRAEQWWRLRVRFEKTYEHVNNLATHPPEEMISIPNCPELIAQLSQPLYFYTESGKLKIEKKEDMRKRGVKSPDHADALVLAFWFQKKYTLKMWDASDFAAGPKPFL